MRTTSRCPKCNGTKLYVCESAQPAHDSSNIIHPMYVTTVPIDQESLGVSEEDGSSYRTPAGRFETWTCAACGYTEWYAKDPGNVLAKLAARGSGVRVVEGTPKAPYR